VRTHDGNAQLIRIRCGSLLPGLHAARPVQRNSVKEEADETQLQWIRVEVVEDGVEHAVDRFGTEVVHVHLDPGQRNIVAARDLPGIGPNRARELAFVGGIEPNEVAAGGVDSFGPVGLCRRLRPDHSNFQVGKLIGVTQRCRAADDDRDDARVVRVGRTKPLGEREPKERSGRGGPIRHGRRSKQIDKRRRVIMKS
jgi:hypothetical protein